MRIKQMILTAILVVTVALVWSLPAGAYGLFGGANNCNQCHPEWPGAQHTLHTGFDCGICHSGEDPVPTSACSSCHDVSEMLALHGPLMDQEGFQCGYCHSGVSAEHRTWHDLKNIFE